MRAFTVALFVLAVIAAGVSVWQSERLPVAETAVPTPESAVPAAGPAVGGLTSPSLVPTAAVHDFVGDDDGDSEDAVVAKTDALAAQLEQQSAPELLATLRKAFKREADMEFEAAKNHLIVRAKSGDNSVVDKLLGALGGDDQGLSARIARMLGEIATPQALAGLLNFARSGRSPQLKADLNAAIAMVGRWRDAGQSPGPLSRLLEDYLTTVAPDDDATLVAVSRALVGLGTLTGTQLVLDLLDQAKGTGGSATPLREQLPRVVQELRNPEPVPFLAGRLRNDPSSSADQWQQAGDILAAMGHPQATAALLNWAATVTTPAAADRAVQWLGQVRDPDSLQLLLGATARQDFSNSQLQERLAAVAMRLRKQAEPD